MKFSIFQPGDEATYVVCVLETDKTPYTDNAHGVCSMCGVGIQWRPHAPAAPKICLRCSLDITKDEPDSAYCITNKTADEVVAHLKKQRH